jgi:hypothetical protein
MRLTDRGNRGAGMKARRITERKPPEYWRRRWQNATVARNTVLSAIDLLKECGATNAAIAARRAQKSIEGAIRHAERYHDPFASPSEQAREDFAYLEGELRR